MQMTGNILERGLLFAIGVNKVYCLSDALVVGFHNHSIADLWVFSDPNLAQFYWLIKHRPDHQQQ